MPQAPLDPPVPAAFDDGVQRERGATDTDVPQNADAPGPAEPQVGMTPGTANVNDNVSPMPPR